MGFPQPLLGFTFARMALRTEENALFPITSWFLIKDTTQEQPDEETSIQGTWEGAGLPCYLQVSHPPSSSTCSASWELSEAVT